MIIAFIVMLIDGHDQNVVLSWYKYNTIIFFEIALSNISKFHGVYTHSVSW